MIFVETCKIWSNDFSLKPLQLLRFGGNIINMVLSKAKEVLNAEKNFYFFYLCNNF